MASLERFDKIPYEDLSPESSWTKLGKGSFGCVFKGEYLGLEVAIKEVMPSGEYDVDKYFQREVKVMQEARHPNIVQYIGLSLAPQPPRQPGVVPRPRILIISEYLPRGNVRSYLYHAHLPFPWRLRLSFAIDVTRGVAYLHARQCLHRDLKGENLLVTENERIKICDFGFARISAQNEEEMRRMSYCGTDGYMSPEILMGEEFGLPSDIFSLGVIFVEILTRTLVDGDTFSRQLPSFGLDLDEVKEAASAHCPPSFLALALSCIEIDPLKRPSIRAILESLRLIELEVLEMEARGIGLNPHAERGTWNVGSVSFAGTSRRGRPQRSAPKIPDWNGTVTLGNPNGKAGEGEKRGSGSEDETSDYDEAMLALDDVQFGYALKRHGKRVEGGEMGESHHGLLSRDDGDEGEHYSTSVLGRGSHLDSTMTVKAFDGHKHARLASTTSSLPSLPPSWIRQASEADGDSPPITPAVDITGHHHPHGLGGERGAGGTSYLTARTTSLSIAGATISHDSDDDELDADERDDVFHSTILSPASPTLPTLHRFSLIKPGFQRFLGSFAPYATPSAAPVEGGSKRASLDGGKRGSVGEDGIFGVTAKCQLCDKRLGILKPFLACDDCGYRCHIKCSDMCPPGCGDSPVATSPTLSLPAPPPFPSRVPPPIPTSSHSHGHPSRLLKKRKGVLASSLAAN
ncbi:hypothetical protein RQP46_006625 [Phenoliferia psychrophenolica]